jgi:hypothetical protein
MAKLMQTKRNASLQNLDLGVKRSGKVEPRNARLAKRYRDEFFVTGIEAQK